ncbi:hemerythrin domain-containing protein [Alkalibacillus aidingensis]|uniref:hemerythrin domain-containing protein n=1 Tax=Alkalibacillus aidingensis TaxID=2747607 RepID=UPI001660B0E2|nr:hemerythrin domain-containing protein [Alkalibacillus aidingensis]
MVETPFQNRNKAMRILENEHRYLQHLMGEWHEIILKFEGDAYESEEEARVAFITLRKKLIEFLDPLKNHTNKEEKYFFEMLGLYIGKEQGPIMSIEEEHQEIDAYIGHFLHHTMDDLSQYSYADMKKKITDASEAYEVLMVHFVKEENVLFPMVDRVMKKDDLDKLTEQLNTLII